MNIHTKREVWNLEGDGVEVVEDGVVGGVSEVGLEVGNAAGAGGLVLDDATHHRHHREAPVSELLGLEDPELLRGLAHAHGVEAGVANLGARG